MTKHNLPLTYAPKIPAVLEGRCTQTIRVGNKFQVGDLISFHGWEGRPYHSKWSFRTPYKEIHTVWNVKLFDGGIVFPEMASGTIMAARCPRCQTAWEFKNLDKMARRSG